MRLFLDEPGEREREVVVGGSIAVELEWALAAARRQDFRRDHAVLARVFDASPALAERVRAFWEPSERTSCGGSIELLIIANHGGLLFSTDADELLGRLEQLCANAPLDLPLESEREEDRVALLGRLGLLRSSAELRKRYVELVGDVWRALAEDWERDGRRAVSTAVDECREAIRRGSNWMEITRKQKACHQDIVAKLVANLGPDGVVAVVPAFFTHLGSLVDLPGMVLFGVRADGSGAQARARTELLAKRLKTISDPTRLAMLEALRSSPRTVSELAELFSLAQPTVSNHVKVLREGGIVANGSGASRRKLEVRPEVLGDLLEHLEGILAVSRGAATPDP